MSYKQKSNDSFKTRLRFFVFNMVLENIEKFSKEDFLKFTVSEELILLYTAEYYQLGTKETLNSSKCKLTINEIYQKVKYIEAENQEPINNCRERYYNEIFKKNFPEPLYNELKYAEECFYCKITKEEIKELANNKKLYKKNERGWNMEIDRKKPNFEYTKDNCVASCYWCNNAKTDEFDDVEFEPIGKLIGETLKNRLEK